MPDRTARTTPSRSTLLVLAGVIVAGGLVMGLRAARGGADADPELAGPGPAVVVRMTDELTFSPATVRIKAGQAVRWTNPSRVVHTATSTSVPAGAASFDSGDIASGQSYSHTFKVAGRYSYHCVPHAGAGMVGTVIVEGG